jgi:ubiquinol-cytochrome c reductase iron-sulfur subunit
MDERVKQTTSRVALVRSVKVLVLLGIGVATVPFVGFLFSGLDEKNPSSDTSGVVVALWELKPGEITEVDWLGRPVWIYRRTPADLSTLRKLREQLRDPDSQSSEQPVEARNPLRSLREEYFVFVPLETSRNCQVHYVGSDEFGTGEQDWYGGFVEPCHEARFDLAGRVYHHYGNPEQRNLIVPPHQFQAPQKLVIGARN